MPRIPKRAFLPSIGKLEHLVLPDRLRVDSGVVQGGEVSPYYDPMIAKLIAHGATRDEAISRLESGLDDSEIWPVRTNAGFLSQLMQHPDFLSGDVDTGLIGRDGEALVVPPEAEADELAEVAANLAASPGDSPWNAALGFRLNASPKAIARLRDDRDTLFEVPFATKSSRQSLRVMCWFLPAALRGATRSTGTKARMAALPGTELSCRRCQGASFRLMSSKLAHPHRAVP